MVPVRSHSCRRVPSVALSRRSRDRDLALDTVWSRDSVDGKPSSSSESSSSSGASRDSVGAGSASSVRRRFATSSGTSFRACRLRSSVSSVETSISYAGDSGE